MKQIRNLLLAGLALMVPGLALGQGAALVHKPITTGHCAQWYNGNTLSDSGAGCGGSGGGVSSVNSKTGVVVLNPGDLGASTLGTTLFQTPSAASARSSLGLGTSAVLDVGTTASKVVQLDGSAKLPAVDGSQLTNLPTSAGVSSFNTRTGAVTLGSGDVTGALGYTPTSVTTLTGVQSVGAFKTGLSLSKSDVGLGSVDNTSDANKPVSTPQQTALNLKADLVGPVLTGTPTAPTPTFGTNNTQIATTSFVQSAVVAGTAGVVSFNTRVGAVTLSSSDVSTALSYVPASVSANLSDMASAATSRTNLGSTTVGDGLFTAANAGAGRATLGLGTASTQNVGTSPNNVVQLDGSSKLPAVDGSQLTNLPNGIVLYSSGGTAVTSPHMVSGSGTLTGAGTLTVALSGSAVFSSSSSYAVFTDVSSTGNPLTITYTSGSVFAFTGAASQAVRYFAIGN